MNMKLAEQIKHFRRYGYVIVRAADRSVEFNKKSSLFGQLNTETLNYFHSVKDTWKYKIWRNFHQVAASNNRHSFPLPMTGLLKNVLNNIVSESKLLLESELSGSGQLIELSCMLSLPGSERQHAHSDIPYSADNLIISGFIALSDVNIPNGPTSVIPGSQTFSFHSRWKSNVNRGAIYYSSDGSEETMASTYNSELTTVDQNGDLKSVHQQDLIDLHQLSDQTLVDETKQLSLMRLRDNETVSERDAALEALSQPPISVTLQRGDVMFFNTQLIHFGEANLSSSPRALICFAFQRPINSILNKILNNNNTNNNNSAKDNSSTTTNNNNSNIKDNNNSRNVVELVDGFTYHCDEHVKHQYYKLQDFPID